MVEATRERSTAETESRSAKGTRRSESVPRGYSVVFYDGVCALCNRSVRFIGKRDLQERYRFASLQSDFAHRTLPLHGCDPGDLDTIYLLLRYGESDESVLTRSQAVFRILRSLGGVWWMVSALGVLPRGLLDFGYRIVARSRYRVFGKYPACPVPTPEKRHLFID